MEGWYNGFNSFQLLNVESKPVRPTSMTHEVCTKSELGESTGGRSQNWVLTEYYPHHTARGRGTSLLLHTQPVG
jgi:hypothetical protein